MPDAERTDDVPADPTLDDLSEAPVPALALEGLVDGRRTPLIARGVLLLVVGSGALLMTSLATVGGLIAATVVVLGLARVLLPPRRRWLGVGFALVLVGAALLPQGGDAGPRAADERVGLFLGAAAVVLCLVSMVRAVRRESWSRGIQVGTAVGAAGLAVTGLQTPLQLSYIAVVVSGLTAIVLGVDALARTVRPEGVRVASRAPDDDTTAVERRRQLLDILSFERDAGDRFVRFMMLMVFATLLAALGIMVDSTAVVIGAMLVAPLMTPLMGVALSLGMGWPRRARRAAGVALAGIVVGVLLAMFVSAALPVPVVVDSNPQILSRIQPTLLDLAVALAAGCAGAYALSRPDVSDALPGVAIAISLVPPLSVIGITLQAGNASAAGGAALLFVTNLVAILIAGVLVFGATGILPTTRQHTHSDSGRATAVGLAAALCLVVGGLALSGQRLLDATGGARAVQTAVEVWVEDGSSDAGVTSVTVEGNTVAVELVAPDPEAVDLTGLADVVAAARGETTELQVGVTARRQVRVEGAPVD
ncbi:MAG: DUF389 domain-containing protein [Actinomycetota bacterium]